MRWEGDEGGPLRARAVERLEVRLATLRPVFKEEELPQLHRRLRRGAHLVRVRVRVRGRGRVRVRAWAGVLTSPSWRRWKPWLELGLGLGLANPKA